MDDILSQGEIDALMSDITDDYGEKSPMNKIENIALTQAHNCFKVLCNLERTNFIAADKSVQFKEIDFDDEITATAFAKEMNEVIFSAMLEWKRAYKERVINTLKEAYIETNLEKEKKLDKVGDE